MSEISFKDERFLIAAGVIVVVLAITARLLWQNFSRHYTGD